MEPLESLIAKLPAVRPDGNLKTRILARIAEVREASYRLHQRIFGALTVLSAVLVVPAALFGIKEVSSSAFGSYLSLLATDSGAALGNWKVFLLSLIESAPIVGTVLVLGAVFALLASLRALAPYIKHTASYTVS